MEINLLEDGLNKTIERISFIKSEDTSIFGYIYDNNNISSSSFSSSSSASSSNSFQNQEETEITYSELIYLRNILVKQLYYRYNITTKKNILIACKGYILPEIISCLACIKLNCSFIPIDTNWIHIGNRLNDIINDCLPIAAIVVANNDNDEIVKIFAKAGLHRCILLQSDGNLIYDESWDSLLSSSIDDTMFNYEVSLSDSLYILYTSGSTGKPKGVPGTHEGLINRILWQSNKYPWKNSLSDKKWNNDNNNIENEENEEDEDEEDDFDSEDIVCRRTPLVFVDSMVEIFGALTSGTKIWSPSRYDPETFNTTKYLPSNKSLLSIAKFGPFVGVSHITLLPSQLTILLNYLLDLNKNKKINQNEIKIEDEDEDDEDEELTNSTSWSSLRIVFVSGESCSIQTIELFQRCASNGYIPNATLINLYGSTEISGDVTATTLCWKNKNNKVYHNDQDESNDLTNFIVCDTLQQVTNIETNITTYEGFVPIGTEIIEGNWCYLVNINNLDDNDNDDNDNDNIFSLVNKVEKEGELFIGGKHVALGYLNNQIKKNDNNIDNKFNDLNEKFMKNPFHKCSLNEINSSCMYCLYPILFRTGDIVKLHPVNSNISKNLNYPLEGSSYHIELLGRKDLTIKLPGGIRIQLEEVERSISSYLAFKYSLVNSELGSNKIVTVSILVKQKNENIIVLYLTKDILTSCNIPIELYQSLLSNDNNDNNKLNSSIYTQFTAYIRNILTFSSNNHENNYDNNSDDIDDNILPVIFLPTLVIPTLSMPLTPSTGKLDRVKLKDNAKQIYDKYFQNVNEDVNELNKDEENEQSIINYLIQLYRGILPLDPTLFLEKEINNKNNINHDNQRKSNITCYAALGGDSMSSIEVRWNISKKYHIEISNDELMTLSIFSLSSLILSKLKDPNFRFKFEDENLNNNNHHIKRKRENEDSVVYSTQDYKKIFKQTLRDIVIKQDEILLYKWKSRGIQGTNNSLINISPSLSLNNQQLILLSHEWKCKLSRCIDTTPLIITSLNIPYNHCCYVGSHSGEVTSISLLYNQSSQILWNVLLGKNIHIEGGISCDPNFKLMISRQSNTNSQINSNENIISYPIYVASYRAIDKDGPIISTIQDINENENENDNQEINGINNINENDSRGQIWCLDSHDGYIIWNTNSLIKDEVKGSPTLLSLTSNISVVICGSHGGVIYVLDALNGSLLTFFDGSVYGSIFASIVSNLQLIDENNNNNNNNNNHNNNNSSANLYIVTTKGYSYCLNLEYNILNNTFQLSMKWNILITSNSPIFGTPSIIKLSNSNLLSNNLVFGTVGGEIYCISCENGSIIWIYNSIPHLLDRSPFFSSPCVIQRLSNKLNENIKYPEYIVIGSHDGWIRFIDIYKGTLQYELEIGSVIYGSPTQCSIEIMMIDLIVVCTTGGDVCLIQGHWKEQIESNNNNNKILLINDWKIISRYKLSGEIYSSPTIVKFLVDENSYKIGVNVGCRDDCVHYLSINIE